MVGRKHLLISSLVFAFGANALFAQEPQKPTPTAPHRPGGKRTERNTAATPNSPEFDNVRRALDALTPEQRLRFQENLIRWINLSPEDKKALRDRDELRRKRVKQEIDNAIRDSGLQLNSEQRELFAKRYAEERRKVEEQLRREMQEKRQPRLREIVGKLKEEFSAPETVPPATSASATQ